jgi:hypothetical protein
MAAVEEGSTNALLCDARMTAPNGLDVLRARAGETGTRAQRLGVEIVGAVRSARDAASAASVPELNVLFQARPESNQDSASQARPERVATSTPQRGRVRDDFDHEVSFDEVDFLSDDAEDDHR